MADSYEELAELGFEGIDKFATHLHDPVLGYMSKHKPHSKRKHGGGQQQRGLPQQEKPPPRRDSSREQGYSRQRDPPPQAQWDIPPAPNGLPPAPLGKQPGHGAYAEARDGRPGARNRNESDSGSDGERRPKYMYSYAPDRRREGRCRDDARYERAVEDGEYYRPSRAAQQEGMRTRDANNYQGALMVRAPSPPPNYGYGTASRGRPMPQRQRSSSWPPPRGRERSYDSRPPRPRSPNQHGALAMAVGALVGGVAGSRVKRDETLPNTVATVGGAVIGGIASREMEKMYDRHKERRAHAALERGGAREKRRSEREYN